MKDTPKKADIGDKSVAYSYIRFSTPEQLEGDSLRRQTEAAREWSQRNGVSLDTKTTFRDLGRSAFTGAHLKNKELGGLATFLAMVEAGRIPSGSFLVCENADRLTRQGGWDAIGLFHKLVMADIRIVLLSPVEQIIDRHQDTMKMMWLLMELSRGHGESGRKQELIGKNWERWRREAAQTKEHRPCKSPFWIDRQVNGYTLNQNGAKVVRLAYKLAGDGWGFIRIARHLREKGIRPISQGKRSDGFFSPAYLTQTLRNPAVWGRCEELDSDDYFPPVISRDEWYRVQGMITGRKKGGGGRGGFVHLLTGLIQNRDTGAVYYPHKATKTKTKVYLTSDYKRGGSTPLASFPVHAVEQAICECVRELDWESIFPNENEGVNKMLALSGEVSELKRRTEEALEALEGGKPLASLLPVLRKWDDRMNQAQGELADLRMKASNPKADLFKDIQKVFDRLKRGDEPELRLKVRSLIGRLIEKIEVEFRGWGKWRGAWATVRFKDSDAFRDIYILYHKPHRIGKGVTKEFLTWDSQWMVKDAECPTAEITFSYLEEMAKNIDAERSEARRERKRLECKRWHEARRKKK